MVQQVVENPDSEDSEDKKDKKIIPLDADDIALLKTYGRWTVRDVDKKSGNRFGVLRVSRGKVVRDKRVGHWVGATVEMGFNRG